MKSVLTSSTAALALGAALVAPLGASAASDHRIFDGTVVHVSDTNIKVSGIEGGKHQVLSFLVDSGTKLRKKIKPSEYVQVVYDQRLLGIRHADSVDPWSNPGMKMKS